MSPLTYNYKPPCPRQHSLAKIAHPYNGRSFLYFFGSNYNLYSAGWTSSRK
ncbi:hypothetical protein Leryth_008046 [Lithospermum erythrorhizon]|nr:hypothetical protein Leryth_008046 [Lithospermum erythrorhizon]